MTISLCSSIPPSPSWRLVFSIALATTDVGTDHHDLGSVIRATWIEKSNLDESDVEDPPIARQPPQVFALISGKEAILLNHMVLKIYQEALDLVGRWSIFETQEL